LCSCEPSTARIYKIRDEYTSGESVFKLVNLTKESQNQENTYTVTFTFEIFDVSSIETVKTYFVDCYVCNSGGVTEEERTYLDEEETKKANGSDYKTEISNSIKFTLIDFVFINYNNEINL